MKGLIVVDDPALSSDVGCLKLLVNLEICSSFKYFPRGHLHEILGLRATGALFMCVGV